jgi:uncharacterized protein
VFTFLFGSKIDWQETANNIHIGPRVEIQLFRCKGAATRQGERQPDAKTSGIRDVLNARLAPLGERIRLAFVYGSIARGDEEASSDVDLMVVGDVSFADVVSALSESESKLGREIDPTVYGTREFREKLAAKNHFLSTVAMEKKLFVIGDEHEFRRLGK